MKIWLLLLGFTFSCPGRAQTWSEWFKQRKTQLKYLGQQLAALQVYTGYVQEGYQIADNGLTVIGAMKGGEFHLFRDFFGAQRTVNPALAVYARPDTVLALLQRLRTAATYTLGLWREAQLFTPAEVAQLRSVFAALLEKTQQCREELFGLLSVDVYGLTDDERLRRVADTQSQLVQLARQVQQLAASSLLALRQRQAVLHEVNHSRRMTGLSLQP